MTVFLSLITFIGLFAATSVVIVIVATGTVALHVLLVDAIVEVERERTAIPGAGAVLPETVAPRLATHATAVEQVAYVKGDRAVAMQNLLTHG